MPRNHGVGGGAEGGTKSALGAVIMAKLTKRMVGLLGLLALVAGCASDPSDSDASDEARGASAEVDNLGQSAQELKWTRPKCMDDTWVCGDCICNACGVEDCRNAPKPKVQAATLQQ